VASLTNLSRPARAISSRGETVGDVVLIDRGEDAPTSVIDIDRFLEKVTVHSLQILGDLDWICGEVEWSMQVRDGCVQHVPLWRWKTMFRWR
jgi:hypothetical protein